MAPDARPRVHRPRNPRRFRRHRRRRLPRHVRAPRGEAGDGRLLVFARLRARDRGLRVPPRRRRRHEPAARILLRQLGHRLRRRRLRPRLRHRPPDPLARGHGHGHLRPHRPRREARRGVAPPDPAPPAGAGRRAGLARVQRHRARVLPLHGHLRGSGRQALARPDAAHLDDRGLPAAADGARGVHLAEDPQRDDRRRHPGRVLQGRGRPRPARGERHLRRGLGDRRPPPGLQERHQGDRGPRGEGGHVHGQVDDGRRGLLVPRAHQPVGPRERRPPHGRCVAPERAVDAGAALPGRPAARRRASWPGWPRRR